MSTISILLNLFLALRRMYTQNTLIKTIYTKPMAEPIRPAYATACGTAINAIPTYILVIFAAVSSQLVVLFFLV